MAGYIGSKSSVTLVDGYTETEADAEFVNDPNGAITVSGSNVGIGTSSPSFEAGSGGGLEVNNSAGLGSHIKLTDSASGAGGSNGFDLYAFNTSGYIENYEAGSIIFRNGGDQRMAINSSGNLFVARTAEGDSNVGHTFRADGFSQTTRSGGIVADFNRLSSNGDILRFQKDGTSVGTIGNDGVNLTINSSSTGILQTVGVSRYNWDDTQFYPQVDNNKNLGHPSYRWEDAFITNGATTGSDANDKQDIATLTNTEMLVAARLSQTFRTYRWKDAVVSKGDSARTHTGTIAQEVQSAFTAEGLNAGDYAMFMSDTWWEHDVAVPAVEAVAEVLDEDGNVTTEAVEAVDAYTRTDTYDTEAEAPEGATSKTRLGIRYPELLSFVAAYNEQRFASIEARLTALEA